jgi:hypothetical protein
MLPPLSHALSWLEVTASNKSKKFIPLGIDKTSCCATDVVNANVLVDSRPLKFYRQVTYRPRLGRILFIQSERSLLDAANGFDYGRELTFRAMMNLLTSIAGIVGNPCLARGGRNGM